MKIFGKWGWCWYRKRLTEINENLRILKRLRLKMRVLEVNDQIKSRYSEMIILKCDKDIARLQLLQEYLKQRKKRT